MLTIFYRSFIVLTLGALSLSVNAGEAVLSTKPNNPYIGAWQFVSGEYHMPDGKIHKASNNTLVAIKTVSEDKFAVINMSIGLFKGYLAGDFKVEGEHYVEVIKDGTKKEHLEKIFRFKGVIETRKENGVTTEYWLHEGKVDDVLESEVWRRLP